MFLWKLGWPLDYYYHKSNIMKKRLINYSKGEIYHIFNAVIHSTNHAHLEWPGWKWLWPVRFLVHDGCQEAMLGVKAPPPALRQGHWSLSWCCWWVQDSGEMLCCVPQRCLPAESGCRCQAHDCSIWAPWLPGGHHQAPSWRSSYTLGGTAGSWVHHSRMRETGFVSPYRCNHHKPQCQCLWWSRPQRWPPCSFPALVCSRGPDWSCSWAWGGSRPSGSWNCPYRGQEHLRGCSRSRPDRYWKLPSSSPSYPGRSWGYSWEGQSCPWSPRERHSPVDCSFLPLGGKKHLQISGARLRREHF